MQIGDNFHEILILFSGKDKKNIISLSSAEFAQRVLKVKAHISSGLWSLKWWT